MCGEWAREKAGWERVMRCMQVDAPKQGGRERGEGERETTGYEPLALVT